MKNLKNKNVLITGGARGIGKQIALEFAKQGANIIICDADKNFMNDKVFNESVNEQFFAVGKKEQWKTQLDGSQIKLIENKFKNLMQKLNYNVLN